MSDDEVKFTEGGSIKFTDPDQGSLMLNAPEAGTFKIVEPTVAKSFGVCRVEILTNGQQRFRTAHEPDEELENLAVTKKTDKQYFLEVSNSSEPSLRVRVRICKHCGCLYAEKS